jgi:hypothetical protein
MAPMVMKYWELKVGIFGDLIAIMRAAAEVARK